MDISPLKFLFIDKLLVGHKNKNGLDFHEAEVPKTSLGKLVVLWMIPQ